MELLIKSPGLGGIKKSSNHHKIPFRYNASGINEPSDDLNQKKHADLKNTSPPLGLKLHSQKKIKLVEQIKDTVNEILKNADKYQVLNYSVYIGKTMCYDYTYLANIFSEVNGISIKQYIIQGKIERVKYYLSTCDISLTEISYLLDYSSVAHLSSQFKKTTGLSPSNYKQEMKRKINILLNG